ncbi:MAG: hypothetical protein V1742_02595, partial [Pseudomonadota bacterium]
MNGFSAALDSRVMTGDRSRKFFISVVIVTLLAAVSAGAAGGEVVFLGDSLTAGGDWVGLFPEVET